MFQFQHFGILYWEHLKPFLLAMQSLIATQITEEMPGNVIGDISYPGRKEQAVLRSMLETSGNLPNVTMQKKILKEAYSSSKPH